MDTVPTTTVVTNTPAPNSSPSASLIPSCVFTTAEYTEKMSGAPFPKARNVTPATLWLRWSESEMTLSAGQKLGGEATDARVSWRAQAGCVAVLRRATSAGSLWLSSASRE